MTRSMQHRSQLSPLVTRGKVPNQDVARLGYASRSARRQRDGGYLLLAILLMMALMIIAATVVAPRIVQQIKRDREEEMIHRGTEYARAIKKFYKKNGRYPSSLDDLDKGQVKYLRKRFKDPLAKDGKWKLLNYGDIQTLLNGATPGTPAAALAAQGGAAGANGNNSLFSNSSNSTAGGFGQQQQQQQQIAIQQQQQQQQYPGANGGFAVDSSGQGSTGTPSSSFGFNNNSGDTQQIGPTQSGFTVNSPTGFSGSGQSGSSTGQSGTTFGQNSAGGNQTFGGGAVVGVASLSKDPTIRIYNKKKTYNEWQFIYNPMMDQNNVLLRGPYQPITIGGNQVGTPASQMNGQNGSSQSPFGQQNGQQQQNSFGQQNNSFGSQPQQTLTPSQPPTQP